MHSASTSWGHTEPAQPQEWGLWAQVIPDFATILKIILPPRVQFEAAQRKVRHTAHSPSGEHGPGSLSCIFLYGKPCSLFLPHSHSHYHRGTDRMGRPDLYRYSELARNSLCSLRLNHPYWKPGAASSSNHLRSFCP